MLGTLASAEVQMLLPALSPCNAWKGYLKPLVHSGDFPVPAATT